jgi:hypothetical protein
VLLDVDAQLTEEPAGPLAVVLPAVDRGHHEPSSGPRQGDVEQPALVDEQGRAVGRVAQLGIGRRR